MTPKLGIIRAGEEPEEVYRSDASGLTQSKLRDYIQSPELYRLKHIEKSVPFEESAEMRMGTALHCAVLEPSHFYNRFVVMPDDMTKRGKAYEAWLADAGNRTVLSANEAQTVRRMHEALLKNADVQRILPTPGDNEVTLRLENKRWGMLIQGKLDALRESVLIPERSESPHPVILDLKTTDDVDKWRRSFPYGTYHIQAWWYRMLAVSVMMLPEPPVFIFVVVERKCPWRVALYEPNEAYLTMAQKTVETAVAGLRDSLKTGVWQRDVPGIQLLHPRNYE